MAVLRMVIVVLTMSAFGAVVALRRRRWVVSAMLVSVAGSLPGLFASDFNDCGPAVTACAGQFTCLLLFGPLRNERRSFGAALVGSLAFAAVAWPSYGFAGLGLVSKVCFVGIPLVIVLLFPSQHLGGAPASAPKVWKRGLALVALCGAVPLGALLALSFCLLTWRGWSGWALGFGLLRQVLQ